MIAPLLTFSLACAAQDRADLRVDLQSDGAFTEDQATEVILTATNAGTVTLEGVELLVTVASEATGVGVAAACSTSDDGTEQVTTCLIGRMQPSSSISVRLPLVPNEAGVLDVALRGTTTTFGEDLEGNETSTAFDVAAFVPSDDDDSDDQGGCSSSSTSTSTSTPALALLGVLVALAAVRARRRVLPASLCVCVVGFGAATTHADEPVATERKPKPMLKQDYVPPIFAAGPNVDDREFAAWLGAHAGPVKLPFTIWRQPRRVGAIGVHAAMPAKTLRFSDGALGIPLDERLRQLCGAEKSEPCRVWLSGRIGESMPLPDPDPSTIFNVHAVHDVVVGEGPHSAFFVRGNECLAIRSMKPMHCARGPARCEKCKEANDKPPIPKLLDVCPYGDVARPTIEIERDGKKTFRVYDVLQLFNDVDEARAFAKKHGLTDVTL